MMQQDEEVGKLAAAVPVMVAKLTETFLSQLLVTCGQVTGEREARTLTQEHVARVIR